MAISQNIKAINVLLSVKSKPLGKPVQYWPNACFCTMGPKTSPPINKCDYCNNTECPVFLKIKNYQKKVTLESNMATNMSAGMRQNNSCRNGTPETDNHLLCSRSSQYLPLLAELKIVFQFPGRQADGAKWRSVCRPSSP